MEDAHDTVPGENTQPPSAGGGSVQDAVPSWATATRTQAEQSLQRPPSRNVAVSDELSTGAQLGRYVVLDRLGAGAMGVVYSAYDPDLDRRVAIKLLRHARSAREGESMGLERARLLREAQALARLSHPNVVAVFDVGEWHEQVFVAMEFVAGDTLRRWLEGGPRSQAEILAVFIDAACGLSAAHQAGLVHRDFKPDNVMVGADGRVRVMDFGLARSEGQDGALHSAAQSLGAASLPSTTLDASSTSSSSRDATGDDETIAGVDVAERDSEHRESAAWQHSRESHPGVISRKILGSRTQESIQLTRAGAIMGTPAYMAPEQFLGLVADARSDQYSFCVALWEALAGARPYGAKGYFELVAAVTSGDPPVWPAKVQIPGHVRAALARGLSQDAAQRYPDLQALRADLEPRTARRPYGLARGVAIAVGLFVALGVTWSLVSPREQAICESAAALAPELWSDARAGAVGAALKSTGLAFVIESSDSVVSALDAYAVEWRQVWRESCEATQVRHEQSETLLDLRTACLRERAVALGATADVLEGGDATAARNAVRLVGALPSLRTCSDPESLTRQSAELSPEQRDIDTGLREELAAARVAYQAGQTARALSELAVIRQRAEADGLFGTLSQVDAVIGYGQHRLGEDQLSIQSHQSSYAAARRASRNDLAAEAASMLAFLYSVELEDLSHGEPWLVIAELDAGLAGDDLDNVEPRARIEHTLAVVAETQLRYDDATKHLDRAIELRRKSRREDVHAELSILIARGNLEVGRNDNVAASLWLEQALELSEDKLGSAHPTTAVILNNLGLTYSGIGENDRALVLLERALAIQAELLGIDSVEYQDSAVNLAMILNDLGQCLRAIPMIEEALVTQRRAALKDTPTIARTEANLASALANCDRLVEAKVHRELSLRIFTETLGPQDGETTRAKLNLADLLARMEEYRAAYGLVGDALTVLGAALDPMGLEQRAWGLAAQEVICSKGAKAPGECTSRDTAALGLLCIDHPALQFCPRPASP